MDFLNLIPLLKGEHINYRGPEQADLERQLRDATSSLLRVLRKEFGRVVVLDAAAGVARGGAFDIELFLRAAWKTMATSLGQFFDESAFHPEQIAQLLKSEEPLLFCFLEVQLFSHRDLQRLRGLGFSQEYHRILYVGANPELNKSGYPIPSPGLEDDDETTDDTFQVIGTSSEAFEFGQINLQIDPTPAPSSGYLDTAASTLEQRADELPGRELPAQQPPGQQQAGRAWLTHVTGARAGQTIELAGERMVIGRHPSCQIVIDSAAISRNHAQLLEYGGTCFLEDLRSRNGTLLNGKKIGARTALRDGDEIRICEVVLQFGCRSAGDREEAAGLSAQATPRGAPLGGMPAGDAGREVNDELIDEAGSDTSSILTVFDAQLAARTAARPEAKLRALMEIRKHVAQFREIEDAFPGILESLFTVFPQAERGCVVLEGEDESWRVRAWRSRRETPGEPPRVSAAILGQAIDKRRAILSADAVVDHRGGGPGDVANLSIRSVMCAPLLAGPGQSLGAIQLDTAQPTPFSNDDLEVLASVAGQVGLALISARPDSAGARDQEQSHDFATLLQLDFVPNQLPTAPGYEFFDFYETAPRVGGDFLDYVAVPGGRIAISVGDVAGKGAPAALLMARICSEARARLQLESSPGESSPGPTMSHLNQTVLSAGAGHRFITMALAILDPQTHTLTLVNAGHLPPLLRRADGKVEPVGVESCTLPLGIKADTQFREITLRFEPGELLLFSSDGATEAMNASHEIYGPARLAKVLSEHQGTARSTIETLVASIDDFCGAVAPRDDMSLVAIKRTT